MDQGIFADRTRDEGRSANRPVLRRRCEFQIRRLAERPDALADSRLQAVGETQGGRRRSSSRLSGTPAREIQEQRRFSDRSFVEVIFVTFSGEPKATAFAPAPMAYRSTSGS